jgi:hypothetical protein
VSSGDIEAKAGLAIDRRRGDVPLVLDIDPRGDAKLEAKLDELLALLRPKRRGGA